MNDLIKIDDITLAIKLLKDGEILVNKKQNKLTYFAFKKDKIHCQNSSLSFNTSSLYSLFNLSVSPYIDEK